MILDSNQDQADLGDENTTSSGQEMGTIDRLNKVRHYQNNSETSMSLTLEVEH